MSDQEERNKQVVLSMLEALSKQDLAALEKHPGLYETRRFHPLMQAAFPDLHSKVEQMIADGDLVATRVSTNGTHKGLFMGVAPTGKQLHWSTLLMDRVVGDQIIEHWANGDWVTVLRELNVIPSPPNAHTGVSQKK